MARRLLEAAGTDWRMAQLLAEQGVAWLLPSQPAEPVTDPSAASAAANALDAVTVDDTDAALEVLTARYAQGDARTRWKWQAAPLPAGKGKKHYLFDRQGTRATFGGAPEIAVVKVTGKHSHRWTGTASILAPRTVTSWASSP